MDLQEFATQHIVIAPHRCPERIACISTTLQEKPRQRQILAPRDGIPKRCRAEVALVLIHGHLNLQARTGFEECGDGLDPVEFAERVAARPHGASDMQSRSTSWVSGLREVRSRRQYCLDRRDIPTLS